MLRTTAGDCSQLEGYKDLRDASHVWHQSPALSKVPFNYALISSSLEAEVRWNKSRERIPY
jgi:hypothetical protein